MDNNNNNNHNNTTTTINNNNNYVLAWDGCCTPAHNGSVCPGVG